MPHKKNKGNTRSKLSDHENYKRSTESSLIWKFARNLDKLLGKKSS